MAFKECLFDTELKGRAGLRYLPADEVVEYGEPWKVEEATQILHQSREMQITSSPKFSGYFHFTESNKDKFDPCQPVKYPALYPLSDPQ